jgi:hypothetical protein
MTSCNSIAGCGPKTHNLHCSYPECAHGRVKQVTARPAVVLLGDADATTLTIAGVTYESNQHFGWLRRIGTERHRMSRPGCQWLDHIAALQQQLATACSVERVAIAAREWAKWKHQAHGEWIEHGRVNVKTGVSLDKATDNLLTAVDGWDHS